MGKKKIGCIGWVMIILFFPLILAVGMMALVLALMVGVIYGIIYGMVYCYKKGKFDNITLKTNEVIGKLYNKAFKKELSKPILSTKGFTIVATVLIFLVIFVLGNTQDSLDTDIDNKQVVSESDNNIVNKDIDYLKDEIKEENKETEETIEIIETSDAEIHFINTGNSDSILIKKDNKAVLIDGGDNDDEYKVVSYLNKQGVTELEYIFATHPDADHIGGLDAVVDSIPVKNVYVSNGDADTKTYSDFIDSIANKGLNPSVPLLNSEFELGSSTLKVLSVANESEANNNSLVLLYTNGEDKVLLMGDAESKIESRLNVSNIDVLKVGHHGSRSSSNTRFIDMVNPKYAVITVGKNNKYGHPHKETMSTLENKNIEVHRNDECGHIVFKSTGNGLKVDCKIGSYDYRESKEADIGVSVVQPKEPIVDIEPTPEPSGNIVYWTSGGSKYHRDSGCSNMNNPSSGSISASGRTPCKKCY